MTEEAGLQDRFCVCDVCIALTSYADVLKKGKLVKRVSAEIKLYEYKCNSGHKQITILKFDKKSEM